MGSTQPEPPGHAMIDPISRIANDTLGRSFCVRFAAVFALVRRMLSDASPC